MTFQYKAGWLTRASSRHAPLASLAPRAAYARAVSVAARRGLKQPKRGNRRNKNRQGSRLTVFILSQSGLARLRLRFKVASLPPHAFGGGGFAVTLSRNAALFDRYGGFAAKVKQCLAWLG